MKKIALTIAGSDPSGGAGIQADLKTFQALDVYGTSVITLITAQNTQDFLMSEPLSIKVIEEQLHAVITDLPPHAVKLGALGSKATLELLDREIRNWDIPIIIDPIFKSTLGGELLEDSALTFLKLNIFPQAYLLTPNLDEASILTGVKVHDADTMKQAAKALLKYGARNVLVTGGHLEEAPIDILYNGKNFEIFEGTRISAGPTHGTGCTFSAAITALLATGHELSSAISKAKRYVELAIQKSEPLSEGIRPLNHPIAS